MSASGVAGLIFAGGAGTRLGNGEKPLTPLGRGTLLDMVLAIVRQQVDTIAVSVSDDRVARYRTVIPDAIDVIPDRLLPAIGPINGLLSGINWAEKRAPRFSWLATFPADTPFLPYDLVARLQASAERSGSHPVVAQDSSGRQNLCALWPVTLGPALSRGIQCRLFSSVGDALDAFGAQVVPFESRDGFFNVNTPADLAEARSRLAMRKARLGEGTSLCHASR